MLRTLIIGFLSVLSLTGAANAQSCSGYPYPYTLTNGTAADANQVMGNFNTILNCTNNLAPLASPHFIGNVGVNTTAPQVRLDLTGGIANFTTGTEDELHITRLIQSGVSWPQVVAFQLGTYNNSGACCGPQTRLDINLKAAANNTLTGDTNVMTLQSNGNVGIGTSSPSYLLYVNGTAYATGAAGALSDMRDKDKVTTLPQGTLDLVAKLRPVSFVWKDPKDDGMKGEQFGFIAQEIETVLPSVVLTQNDTRKTKGIKYTEIIPLLTKALQEQQAEIEQLRAMVAALKSGK
jgi:hypothetical protein